MERDEREDEALEILEEIVEDLESFRVFAFSDIGEGAELRSDERDMFLSEHDLEFLSADLVRVRPVLVILPKDH